MGFGPVPELQGCEWEPVAVAIVVGASVWLLQCTVGLSGHRGT